MEGEGGEGVVENFKEPGNLRFSLGFVIALWLWKVFYLLLASSVTK